MRRCRRRTWALCEFLGREPTETLTTEMARVERERIYERRVLFVRNPGFGTPTEARLISFADSQRFETAHERVCRRFGDELVDIQPAAWELASRWCSRR